jgi:hypothetical protein
MTSVLRISEEDVASTFTASLGRPPTDEEIDEAANWVRKDFDFSRTFESIENILRFRMPQLFRKATNEEEEEGEEEDS